MMLMLMSVRLGSPSESEAQRAEQSFQLQIFGTGCRIDTLSMHYIYICCRKNASQFETMLFYPPIEQLGGRVLCRTEYYDAFLKGEKNVEISVLKTRELVSRECHIRILFFIVDGGWFRTGRCSICWAPILAPLVRSAQHIQRGSQQSRAD